MSSVVLQVNWTYFNKLWMASLTRWTWVSVNSGSWCWTGRPGVLQFMGLQRVGHDWATDLVWSGDRETELRQKIHLFRIYIFNKSSNGNCPWIVHQFRHVNNQTRKPLNSAYHKHTHTSAHTHTHTHTHTLIHMHRNTSHIMLRIRK